MKDINDLLTHNKYFGLATRSLLKSPSVVLKPTFFSSSSIITLKRRTSLTTTSSFLYRIWKVLLEMTSSWTEAGNARSEPRQKHGGT